MLQPHGTQITLQQPYPFVRIGTVPLALPSGNAILWDLSPPVVNMMRAARRRFSYQRRAFTTRLGVVRISRLGNSDSTACRSGARSPPFEGIRNDTENRAAISPWVPKWEFWRPAEKRCGRFASRSKKPSAAADGFLLSRAGHWPPSILWAVVESTAPFAGYPGRSPPCGAASLADALAGCLPRLWAGRISPAAGTSLAHSL